MTTKTIRKNIFSVAGLIGLICVVGLFVLFTLTAADGAAQWPQQSGTNVLTDSHLVIDASNCSKGYFMAAVSEATDKRLKLRVKKGEMTLTYDLNGEMSFEVFPLQLGSGTYEVGLYKGIDGKKYAQEGSVVLEASLEREDGAFLFPNQYINYTEDSPLVAKAAELGVAGDEKQTFSDISSFMTSEFVYDYVRSVTVQPGELPDADGCYERRMGICQDLSAVMVAMLRSKGIASRMMIGYADANYHAWTETVIGGEPILFDPTAELDAIAPPKEYTVERYY